jgi:hypothetical protein
MPIQTEINLHAPRAFAGQQGDSWHGQDVKSRVAGTAGVNPGLAVTGTGNTVHVPAGNLTNLQGVVLVEAKESKSPLFEEGEIVPVLAKGRVWCLCEDPEDVTLGQAPFVRHTANGANTILGIFRSDAGTAASAAVLSTAKVTEIDLATGLIEISIDVL